MLQDISPIQKTWNKVVYGWDLMQIGKTLIVVPDLNHWLMVENDPEKLKTSFDMQKFADQVAAKGVTDLIFKATDATRKTGVQYTDKTAPFWHWLGRQFEPAPRGVPLAAVFGGPHCGVELLPPVSGPVPL